MIFGSMSHRDIEAPKVDKMNHSQMSHQSGNALRIPPGKPVRIQNLNKPLGGGVNGTNSSSGGENQSMPPSDSDKILDLNVQSLQI